MSKPMSDQSRAPTTNRAGKAALMIAMLAVPAAAFAASARIPVQMPAPPPANDVPSIMMVAILTAIAAVAGMLGGLVVKWLTTDKSALPRIEIRLADLEKWRQEARQAETRATAERDDIERIQAMRSRSPYINQARQQASEPLRRNEFVGDAPKPSLRKSPPPPMQPQAPTQPVATTGPSLDDVVAGYGRLVSGQISRSAFQDYFENIGPYGAIKVTQQGRSIEEAAGDETFLMSVLLGQHILVFPSYEFVSNMETQFNTIASVPEPVAQLFELGKGDGEIVVEAPAIFDNLDGTPVFQSSGVMKGFGG